ncbi:MAG: response regulator transcription factor [Anaerolineales bacterium]|nr:response regulator transcription factor [Anaerolineales bacterium]
MPSMQALLFSFNNDERSILRLVLQRIGLAVQTASSLEQVNEEWPSITADLIVLAPKYQISPNFVRQMRAIVEVPLVIITDIVPEDTFAEWLDSGVDLIVFRPFSGRILIAQIRALLRRSAGIPFFSLPSIVRGEITLDPSTRTVKLDQYEPRQLTQLEFRLLYTLMTHSDQVLPAETLVEHVWGYSDRGDRNLVRGLVRRLRSKIEPEPKSPQYIITIPRVGYVFKYQT